tara:strand:- start:400 stop:729 length:330 start_codon:yes stop_codon:yes gene_type:complete
VAWVVRLRRIVICAQQLIALWAREGVAYHIPCVFTADRTAIILFELILGRVIVGVTVGRALAAQPVQACVLACALALVTVCITEIAEVLIAENRLKADALAHAKPGWGC